MARLHEYQGKALLREHGIDAPAGEVIGDPESARAAAERLGGRVVLKVQAWVTGRKSRGGVAFCDSPEDAAKTAERMLGMRFGNFPVREVLVESLIDINHEFFVSLSIDDATRAPVLLLDTAGGTGIEERADKVHRLPVDLEKGVDRVEVERIVNATGVDPDVRSALVDAIVRVPEIAKKYEARALEINPLVTTHDGRVLAADCRMTIDDYAVFRHPELGITIARELDHPATDLEKIAYTVEQNDHRGTFYFAQLPTDDAARTRGVIGFHGAGGGGSMMSMDAVTNAGFTLANFCDTSGNPSAAKVYRAARIILLQDNLVGYFGSGSGVASQEQYHSAYGLAKAFIEVDLDMPAVVRLGGNSEDRAVEILEDACRDLPATVEGYRKDDTPAFCAERFATLVEARATASKARLRHVPSFVNTPGAYSFPITDGRVWIDHAHCTERAAACAVQHSANLLALNADGKPVCAVSKDEVAGKDSELIACEIECRRAGSPIVFVDLGLPSVDA